MAHLKLRHLFDIVCITAYLCMQKSLFFCGV